MRVYFGSLRFLLQITWLIPVFWIMGAGWAASAGPLLSLFVFILFGLVIVVESSAWDGGTSGSGSSRAFLAREAGVVVAAGALALVPPLLGWQTLGVNSLLNWLILVAVAAIAARLGRQETTYQNILSSFMFGLFALIFLISLLNIEVQHLHGVSPLTYFGVGAYGLLGMFALASSRRYCLSPDGRDRRVLALEPEWLLSTVLLMGGVVIVALILVEIFGYDFMGQFGNLLQPVWSGTADKLTQAGQLVVSFIQWIAHLLGIRPVHHHTPKVKGHHHPKHTRPTKTVYQLHPSEGSKLAESILEALIILVIGAAVLGGLVFAVRKAFELHQPARAGQELRLSSWTWRKMLSWLFRRARMELASAVPHRPALRRTRMRTVRDVYRAFLALGRARARPREASETGLEYSHDVEQMWSDSAPALQRLNELYMEERYGGEPVTAEALDAAKHELDRLEALSAAPR